jgi:hypothetical protein
MYVVEGMSREDIGSQLGRTIMAIDNKVERLKLRRADPGFRVTAKNHLSRYLIYFILDSDKNCVKIGKTTDLGKRLASLQVGNPTPLSILGVIDVINEKFVHDKFAKQHVLGEWFQADEELMAFIEKRTRQP